MNDRASSKSNRRTALVTGASGGIGYELAKLFARDHYDLVLVARSRDKLEQLADELQKKHGIAVMVISKDLTSPSAPQEIYDEVQGAGVHVDILVNNAGYTIYGPFTETKWDEELGLIQVNITALTHLTKLFLPGMIASHWGKVLNLGSTASFMPGPLMALYYASKAYVLSFSEALASELKGTGVSVTALCPGPTWTGFQSRAGIEGVRLLRAGVMEVKPVALAGYKGLMNGKTVVVPGRSNQFLIQSVRFMPRNLLSRVVKLAQQRGH